MVAALTFISAWALSEDDCFPSISSLAYYPVGSRSCKNWINAHLESSWFRWLLLGMSWRGECIQNKCMCFWAMASGVGSLLLLLPQYCKVLVKMQKREVSSMAEIGPSERAAFISGEAEIVTKCACHLFLSYSWTASKDAEGLLPVFGSWKPAPATYHSSATPQKLLTGY